jgi:phosphoserine aminotransferase
MPESVLKQAAEEMLDYKGTGMSIMEMSHRSKAYLAVIQEADALIRELMNIPDNYKVLWLQGGASTQFAMVPLNLMKNKKADFIMTGQWSDRAKKEAERYLTVNVAASSEDKKFTYVPELDPSKLSPDADYLHFTPNDTAYGVRFTKMPESDAPLVADMSSCILSEEYDVSKFGIIYAGAQKNLGMAGLTVVIIHDDLIGHADPVTPTMLNYKTHADGDSLYNTPTTYAIYIAILMFKWLKGLGGVKAIQKINEEKAKILYDCIDGSGLFKSGVVPKDRSLMNVIFTTGSEDLDKQFVNEAKDDGLVTLAGYRTIGGMRASIYNAMPVEGVIKLTEFMKKFEVNHV